MSEIRSTDKSKKADKAKKISNILISSIFSVLVIGVGVYAFLAPKPTYSESEKRELAKMPELTVENIADGTFTDGYDIYFSDTFPGRDTLVDFATTVKDFKGVRAFVEGGKTIYTADDDMYSTEEKEVEIDESKFNNAEKIEISDEVVNTEEDEFIPGQHEETKPDDSKNTEADVSEGDGESGNKGEPEKEQEEQKKNDKPVGAEGPAGEKRGSLYVVGNTALELFRGNEVSSKIYAEAINTYAKYLPETVNIYDMVVPTHTEFALPLSDRSVSNEQRPVLDAIRDNLVERITFVDPYDKIREHYEMGEYLYFRSDHHWTALGAYYAYAEFCEVLGFEPVDITSYETGRIEPFLGTFYQSSRDAALKASPDYVDYYKVDVPMAVTRYDANGGAYNARLYYTYVKGEANSYLAFLGGDFPYIKAVTENKNGRKLIVFKESYGNPLIPFLAPHFEEIHVADIRYFPYNAVNFINQYGVTDVLFVNGLMSASTGARVDEIYGMLNK